MNKFIVPLGLGLLLSSSAAALAPDTPKLEVSPASIKFNRTIAVMPSGHPAYQINGSTYVPLRFLVDQTGGTIHYDETYKTIDIQYPKKYVQSQLSSTARNSDFKLKIHSEKPVYRAGEGLSIWATLEYLPDTEKVITHSSRLLSFAFTDDKGNSSPAMTLPKLEKTRLKKDMDLYASFTPYLIQNYNHNQLQLELSGPEDWDHVPTVLPPGRYSIGAFIRYSDGDDTTHVKPITLAADLEIEVK
ncbi:stalk domain-containing protein [Paenibacillus filicis]|uniref:Stalk domain-containing protein n=1 Tax=Paenibacillus filicis TaxID=669464 RepID=A0ABU9DW15_9BACL